MNCIVAIATIDTEIFHVGSDHFGFWEYFGQANDAGVGEIHDEQVAGNGVLVKGASLPENGLAQGERFWRSALAGH